MAPPPHPVPQFIFSPSLSSNVLTHSLVGCSSCAGPHGLSTVCHRVTFYLSHIWHSLELLCLSTQPSHFNVEDFFFPLFSVKNATSFLCSNCVRDALVLETRLRVHELSAEFHAVQICYERELPQCGKKNQNSVSIYSITSLQEHKTDQ